MPTYRSGDVVIISYPLSGGTGSKSRPAVVLFDTGDLDIVVIPATTQGVRSEHDIEIAEWQRAGFERACCIRVDKPQTLEKKLITKKPGSLAKGDWSKIQTALRKLLPL